MRNVNAMRILVALGLFLFLMGDTATASHYFFCECRAQVISVGRYDTIAYPGKYENEGKIIKPLVLRFRVLEEVPPQVSGPYVPKYTTGSPQHFDKCAELTGTEHESEFHPYYGDYVRIAPGGHVRLRLVNAGDVYGSTLSWSFQGMMLE